MFSADDTIVAIATPPGRGGIGIVRISGPLATTVAAGVLARTDLEPRRATLVRVQIPGAVGAGPLRDTVIATFFPNPHSYTGEDVVEISAHGSPVVLGAIVKAAMQAGARLAEPGEFTLRSFLNGKRDLVQAEAVGDLIAAATPLQARVAFDQLDGTLTGRIAAIDAVLFDLIARLEASLDFPDEGYHFIEPSRITSTLSEVIDQIDALLEDGRRGRMIRDGATVAIVGRPNVGKSSLFNRLVGAERAIVTAVPGTTRDLISEQVGIGGLALTIVDTAGVRDSTDAIEREGIARAARAQDVAALVLVVIDRSEPMTVDDERLLIQTRTRPRLIVLNKADRAAAFSESALPAVPRSSAGADRASIRSEVEDVAAIKVSATSGEGLDALRRAIARAVAGEEDLRDAVMISNIRHIALLEDAVACLRRARDAGQTATPEEFLLSDLAAARMRFEEIVGTRTSDDVLRHIFERFCVGK